MEMTLEQMKIEYEAAKDDYDKVTTKTARKGITSYINELKGKIDDVERRSTSKLKVRMINGVEYEMPRGFHYYEEDKYTYEVKDGCLYRFEAFSNFRFDKDGTFHSHCHVWIPQKEDRYVDLCVKILGGDYHGERYFLSATYYKHPSDSWSYLHKDIHCKNFNYRPHYSYIIEKMGLKPKKDRWKGNLLEWIEGSVVLNES